MSEEQKKRGPLFLLLGCAAICLLALVGAAALGAYVLLSTEARPVEASYVPTRWGDPRPTARGEDAPAPPSPSPRLPRLRVAATVTTVTGQLPVSSGARCVFDVDPPSDTGSMCRAQIVCGGQLLYGGQNAGYFACVIEKSRPPAIEGSDDRTTSADGDAAMTIDTRARLLRVRDDERGPHGGFQLDARIDSVD